MSFHYISHKVSFVMFSRRLFPPPTGLPSGYTALDYITVSSLDERIVAGSFIGASDVVFLDHQFSAIPTWSSAINPESFYLFMDAYRSMWINAFDFDTTVGTDYRAVYLYLGYNTNQAYAPHSAALTTARSMLYIPNSAFSLNGVIYPSSTLSAMIISGGTTGVQGSAGEFQMQPLRVYGCYILDVLDWRHYMVPCERSSDGRQGLYDVVDGVFVPVVTSNIPYIGGYQRDSVVFSHPVTSKLSVVLSSRSLSSTLTLSVPKGSSSVTITNSSYYGAIIHSVSPISDDTYVYLDTARLVV